MAIALAYLALDDITTGRQSSFVFEYSALLAVTAWLLGLAARLARRGQRLLGILSIVVLAAAVVAQRSIGPGTRPSFAPEYLATVACMAWFCVLSCILLADGVRQTAARDGG
ncbi:MAG: hypothetical protein AAB225_08125 [Acidobacteriota bacterium]